MYYCKTHLSSHVHICRDLLPNHISVCWMLYRDIAVDNWHQNDHLGMVHHSAALYIRVCIGIHQSRDYRKHRCGNGTHYYSSRHTIRLDIVLRTYDPASLEYRHSNQNPEGKCHYFCMHISGHTLCRMSLFHTPFHIVHPSNPGDRCTPLLQDHNPHHFYTCMHEYIPLHRMVLGMVGDTYLL